LDLYNRAAEQAAEALRLLRGSMGSTAPTLAAAVREASASDFPLLKVFRGHRNLEERVTAFCGESTLVQSGGDALVAGDLPEVGRIVDMSQRTAELLLGNQVPETIALAASARQLGAVAASAFGAGFGGSVYALVKRANVEEFRCRWAERYAATFPRRKDDAGFIVSNAGPPATKL
jgi:galactokinase